MSGPAGSWAMRGRLALASAATLAGALGLILVWRSWEPCFGPTCGPPPFWVRGASLGSFALLLASAVALFGALFPDRRGPRRPVAAAALAALTLAGGAGYAVSLHSGSCFGSSSAPMVCTETYPRALADAFAYGAIFLLAFALAGGVHLLLASRPRSRTRIVGARVALALLALVLLAPSLSMIGWWTNAPADATWQRDGGQLCVRWAYGNGGGESCRTLGSVVALPLVIAAGGSAALQAGRPSWHWAGWGAVALAGTGAFVIAAANLASPVRSDWWGLAAVAAGLALVVKLLHDGRAAART